KPKLSLVQSFPSTPPSETRARTQEVPSQPTQPTSTTSDRPDAGSVIDLTDLVESHHADRRERLRVQHPRTQIPEPHNVSSDSPLPARPSNQTHAPSSSRREDVTPNRQVTPLLGSNNNTDSTPRNVPAVGVPGREVTDVPRSNSYTRQGHVQHRPGPDETAPRPAPVVPPPSTVPNPNTDHDHSGAPTNLKAALLPAHSTSANRQHETDPTAQDALLPDLLNQPSSRGRERGPLDTYKPQRLGHAADKAQPMESASNVIQSGGPVKEPSQAPEVVSGTSSPPRLDVPEDFRRQSDSFAVADSSSLDSEYSSASPSPGRPRPSKPKKPVQSKKKGASMSPIPPEYFVKGRINIEKKPCDGGGFCKLFKDRHGNNLVALKLALRNKDEEGKEVCDSHIWERALNQFSGPPVKMLLAEARVWRTLSHSHILLFCGLYKKKGRIYMVSPWADNGPLPQYLKQHSEADRCRFKPTDRTQQLRETADALHYLSNNSIIHGDIKGSNIVVSAEVHALLCDFGLSKSVSYNTIPPLSGFGSHRWMAPELHAGEHKSFASDTFSFGMTIYEILSGKFPLHDFGVPTLIPSAIANGRRPPRDPHSSPSNEPYGPLWDIAEQCWQNEPNARPPMQEIHRQLCVLSPLPPTSPDQNLVVVPENPSQPNKLRVCVNKLCCCVTPTEMEPASVVSNDDTATLTLDDPSIPIPITFKRQQVIATGRDCDFLIGTDSARRNFVLKRYRSTIHGYSSDDRAIIRNETTIWRGLSHRHILNFLGTGEDSAGLFYLASPRMENGALPRYLSNHAGTVDRPRFVVEIADALVYLKSRRVVHGDIKAANILVSADRHALLCNFSLSSVVGENTSQPLRSRGIESIPWQSPELLQSGSQSFASDIYAFGITIYEGREPSAIIDAVVHRGERPTKPIETDSDHAYLWGIAEQCWKRDPKHRPGIDMVSRWTQQQKFDAPDALAGSFSSSQGPLGASTKQRVQPDPHRVESSNTADETSQGVVYPLPPRPQALRSSSLSVDFVQVPVDSDGNGQSPTLREPGILQLDGSPLFMESNPLTAEREAPEHRPKDLSGADLPPSSLPLPVQSSPSTPPAEPHADRQEGPSQSRQLVSTTSDRPVAGLAVKLTSPVESRHADGGEHLQVQHSRTQMRGTHEVSSGSSPAGPSNQTDVLPSSRRDVVAPNRQVIPSVGSGGNAQGIVRKTLDMGALLEAVGKPDYATVTLDDPNTTQITFDPNRIVAQGGYCDVFMGAGPNGRQIALKRYRIAMHGYGKEDLQVIENKAKMWRDLEHEFILPFLGIGQDPTGLLYLASPWMDNGILPTFLRENSETADRPRFILEVAEALHYLESKRVIHGDIKAANILVSADHHALLCNFELSTLFSVAMQKALKGAGSTPWQSPEILKNEPKSYASDIYAFGMTIYEVLTSSIPFHGREPPAIMYAVVHQDERPTRLEAIGSHAYLWDIAERCWNKDPENRPSIQTVLRWIQRRKCEFSEDVYGLTGPSSGSQGPLGGPTGRRVRSSLSHDAKIPVGYELESRDSITTSPIDVLTHPNTGGRSTPLPSHQNISVSPEHRAPTSHSPPRPSDSQNGGHTTKSERSDTPSTLGKGGKDKGVSRLYDESERGEDSHPDSSRSDRDSATSKRKIRTPDQSLDPISSPARGKAAKADTSREPDCERGVAVADSSSSPDRVFIKSHPKPDGRVEGTAPVVLPPPNRDNSPDRSITQTTATLSPAYSSPANSKHDTDPLDTSRPQVLGHGTDKALPTGSTLKTSQTGGSAEESSKVVAETPSPPTLNVAESCGSWSDQPVTAYSPLPGSGHPVVSAPHGRSRPSRPAQHKKKSTKW
ncbi:hypothetical protein FRB99_008938, partial [Tulasnella sp. 403]